jgi:hypothetical protein
MPGPSRETEMAAAGLSRALRTLRGDGTRAAVINGVVDATGASESSAKAWYDGAYPCDLGNLFALAEAFGASFLTEVFAELDIACMTTDEAAMMRHGVAGKAALAARDAASKYVHTVDLMRRRPDADDGDET